MRLIDADAFEEEIARIDDLRKLSTKTIGEALKRTPTIEAVPLDGAYIKQIRWERDIALQQLADIGCELGRDMTDIKKKLGAASVVQKMTDDVELLYPKLTFNVGAVYPSEWILEQLKRTKEK